MAVDSETPVAEKPELETVEDDLYAHLKKLLADGEIKSTDSKLLLELAERRAGRVPKGAPIPGLLRKLPFENDEMVSGVVK